MVLVTQTVPALQNVPVLSDLSDEIQVSVWGLKEYPVAQQAFCVLSASVVVNFISFEFEKQSSFIIVYTAYKHSLIYSSS